MEQKTNKELELEKEIALLEKEYQEKWNYKPNSSDFLCTKDEYIESLKKSIAEGKELSFYLKQNSNNIKNASLIHSLNNSAISKTSERKLRANARHDTRATSNINKIKYGTDFDGRVNSNVVGEVNELRTVQDSKRIAKTRHVVIVRDAKEHPKTPIAKFANIMSFVAIAVVGIFLGIFVGNIYISNKSGVDYSSISEAAYLPNYSQIYSQNKNKEKNKVSAANAYSMAEWQLLKESGIAGNYTVTGNGTVRAKVGGINQTQTVIKTIQKTDDTLMIENITLGLITTAEKTILSYGEKTLQSYITSDANEGGANYKANPTKVYDLSGGEEEFRKEYGISAYSVFPYLVSEKTVSASVPAKTVDGGYQYKVTLNNLYGVINYVYYMMHMSGLNRPPIFYNLSLTFTVDEDYKFKEIVVDEEYQIYYMGLPANCTANTTYTFSYGG